MSPRMSVSSFRRNVTSSPTVPPVATSVARRRSRSAASVQRPSPVVEGRPSYHLLARSPIHLEESLVHLEQHPVREPGDADRVRAVVEGLRELLLRLTQRLLEMLTFGVVPGHADQTVDPPLGVPYGHERGVEIRAATREVQPPIEAHGPARLEARTVVVVHLAGDLGGEVILGKPAHRVRGRDAEHSFLGGIIADEPEAPVRRDLDHEEPVGNGVEHFPVEPLALGEALVQRGQLPCLGFERPARVGVGAVEPHLLEAPVERGEQLVRLERLDEVIVGADPQRLDGRAGTGVRGHDHANRQGEFALDVGNEVRAVIPAQPGVDERHVAASIAEEGERFVRGSRSGHLAARGQDHVSEAIAEIRVVIDEQYTSCFLGNAFHRGVPGRPPAPMVARPPLRKQGGREAAGPPRCRCPVHS